MRSSDLVTFVLPLSQFLALVAALVGFAIATRTYPGETKQLQDDFATAWLVSAVTADKLRAFVVASSNGVAAILDEWFGQQFVSWRAASVSLHVATASAMLWWAYLMGVWQQKPSVMAASSFLGASAIFAWTATRAGVATSWQGRAHYAITVLLALITCVGIVSPETVWAAANLITERTPAAAFVHPPITLLSLFLGASALIAVQFVFWVTAAFRNLVGVAISTKSVEKILATFVLAAVVGTTVTLGPPWLMLNVVWRDQAVGDRETMILLYAAGTIVILIPVLAFIVLAAVALLNRIAALVARIVYPGHQIKWDEQRWLVLTVSLGLLASALGPLLKR